MNATELQVLKVIWAYVVDEGIITNGEWSYYGGHFEAPTRYKQSERDAERKAMRDAILQIGVAWDKLDVPEYQQRSEFVGTGNDSAQTDTLLGTLILNDGTTYMLGVDNCDMLYENYAETLRKVRASTALVSEIFGEGA